MNGKLICKDLQRNKAVSIAVLLFITAAATLLSLAAALCANLTGAVDQLMLDAKTPHFMQMHAGELDISKLQIFAKENRHVADFQVLEFLNIDSAQIILGENSLSGSVQDNGFCMQSEQFDFLLDMDNQPVYPNKGEVYVPICYFKDGTAKLDDRAFICGQPFTVKGFVRDSQMNSALASSKRFVVNQADLSRLEPFGKLENLIEFRLRDLSALREFEADYISAKLPSNGPALTLPLIQMLSAISDGIMIAVIVIIGALVIFIALLCVRFTLLARIEDDYREIGAMKAIGMRLSHIRGIYLAIYSVLAGIGSIAGFLFSLLLREPLQKNIQLNLGDSGSDTIAMICSVAGMAFVFLLVLFYVSWSLRRLQKISAVQAIRFGALEDAVRASGSLKLSKNKIVSTNSFLALKDVLVRKRLYATMLAVVILASFIMIVPQNLCHTISGDDFVTYMGVGRCDLRLDIQQTDQIEKKTAAIGRYMNSDDAIARYALFVTKIFLTELEDGTAENIKVELGDHTVFPIQYASGRMPLEEHEIALSAINADELGKQVGSRMTLMTSAGEKQLTICGIYSDITNGGKTAKACFSDDATNAAWSVVCATLTDPYQISGEILAYTKNFPYVKASSLDEYMNQIFGQTRGSVQTASFVSMLVAAAITLLVTWLSVKLLVAKDRYAIAVLRAVGFTCSDIRRQYAWRAAIILIAGVILGTILAGTLGETLSSMAISSLGAAAFHFAVNSLFTYVLCPAVLLIAALIATICGTLQAGKVHIYQSIKE